MVKYKSLLYISKKNEVFMKKKILCIFASIIILSSSVCAFAENYVNVTIGFPFGVKVAMDEGDAYADWSVQVTGEFFKTLSDSSFGLGAKIGGNFGVSALPSVTYDEQGFLFAPAIGWFFNGDTNQKITLYPIAYHFFNLTNGESDENASNDEIKDGTLSSLKSGAAFSWQWGKEMQHGFEIGFDISWFNMLKIDGKKLSDSAKGFDINLAYKFSYQF